MILLKIYHYSLISILHPYRKCVNASGNDKKDKCKLILKIQGLGILTLVMGLRE